MPLLISISWPSLVTSWVAAQKIYSKMHLVSCTNTHRDVTDSLNHGMVKNTKTWISWEQNIIFLWNKKILNLCCRWHILRSYHLVAEVTFNIKHFWGLFLIKLLQKPHWYDYMPFVMLKGQKCTFWKDLAKFVCNFKELSQKNPITEFLV